MEIQRQKTETLLNSEKQKEDFISPDSQEKKPINIEENRLDNPSPRETLTPCNRVEEIYNILLKWHGTEYEHYEVNKNFLLISTIALSAIIIYYLIDNDPIAAITFILVGVASYLYLRRSPREVDFFITDEGVIVENELYEFDQIRSFWIFYEPSRMKAISLHMKESIFPFVRIPLHSEDPVKIREILIKFIPEKKQEPIMTDVLERFIHF